MRARRRADGRFEVQSRVEGRDTRTMHASGEWATEEVERPSDAEPLESLRLRACVERLDVDVAYEAMIGRQMQYGPAFRTVRELRSGPGEVLALLELRPLPEEARFAALLPPPLLDGVFQSLIALFQGRRGAGHGDRGGECCRRSSGRWGRSCRRTRGSSRTMKRGSQRM